MKNPHNIEKLLTSWGLSQRALPDHNEELKRKALASLSTTAAVRTSSAPRHMPWLSVAFTGLAMLTIVLNVSTGDGTRAAFPTTAVSPAYDTIATGGGSVGIDGGMTLQKTANYESEASMPTRSAASSFAAPMMADQSRLMPEYYPMPVPPPYQTVPVKDTREFLKTDYNALIRARNVPEMTRRIATTVRGFGGRVDSTNSTEKWGSLSFAVPESKFDDFQTEIESLVSQRFINIETHTQNLLPQKQSIEEQQKQIEKDLADYKASRQQLVASHARNVASLKSQIDSLAYQIATTQNQQLLQSLLIQQSEVQSRLSSENASYSRQLNYADDNIKQAESNKQWIVKQDESLLDNVATVQGTISINWISIWEVVTTYVSLGWIVVILLAGAAISYWFDRRRSKLELI